MSALTELERWTLCQAMPRAGLKTCSLDATDRQLLLRRIELCIAFAYFAAGPGERGLVNMGLWAQRTDEPPPATAWELEGGEDAAIEKIVDDVLDDDDE